MPSRTGTVARSPRYFTTQRKQWLQHEAKTFFTTLGYVLGAFGLFSIANYLYYHDQREREYPTPHEWSFVSRTRLRSALNERKDNGTPEEVVASKGGDLDPTYSSTRNRGVRHGGVCAMMMGLLSRLEDPKIDAGNDLVLIEEEDTTQRLPFQANPEEVAANVAALTGESRPPKETAFRPAFSLLSGAYDVSAKSEPWRRGYFQALMTLATSCERIEGAVIDRTSGNIYLPNIVVGPSNPNPAPLPPGIKEAPREENCEVAFPSPGEIYLKILNTRGLTTRQQITAALSFANYLDFKKEKDAAAYVYGKAVLASREPLDSEGTVSFFDRKDDDNVDAAAWVKNWTSINHSANAPISDKNPAISQNLLSTLTAYATFQARSGDLSGALPLYVSLLQARLSLPPSSSSSASKLSSSFSSAQSQSRQGDAVKQIRSFFAQPDYPPAPDDGFGPPLPGSRSTCEAAALRMHIGEILYASAGKSGKSAGGAPLPSSSSSFSWNPFSSRSQEQQAREEGIAWTREAVDIAEEQLHVLEDNGRQATKKYQKRREQGQGGLANALGETFANMTASDNKAALNAETGRAACSQCLVSGLDNWTTMVTQMARDEQRRAAASAVSASSANTPSTGYISWWPSWLTLWGDSSAAAATIVTVVPSSVPGASGVNGAVKGAEEEKKLGRWAAEERVIKDRRRRAQELMDEPEPPRGFLDLFKV